MSTPTKEEIRQAYKTLGLSEGASKEDIRKAYLKLASR
jgi:DnaJ-class molecular chaperone